MNIGKDIQILKLRYTFFFLYLLIVYNQTIIISERTQYNVEGDLMVKASLNIYLITIFLFKQKS